MSPTTLAALPQFLTYLTTFPSPEKVLVAMRAGVLRPFGATSAYLSRLNREDELVAVATLGHTPQEQERYAVIPLGLDLPAAQAVRENRMVVDDSAYFSGDRLAAIDSAFAADMLTRAGTSSVITVPIVHRGLGVGAFGLLSAQPWRESEDSLSLLDGIAAALGLWMTHPQSGLADSGAVPVPRSRSWSLVLTDRQRDVLRRVENDESTPAIARALRTSESTVKQDLAHVMRILRTTDRRAAAARARSLGLLT